MVRPNSGNVLEVTGGLVSAVVVSGVGLMVLLVASCWWV